MMRRRSRRRESSRQARETVLSSFDFSFGEVGLLHQFDRAKADDTKHRQRLLLSSCLFQCLGLRLSLGFCFCDSVEKVDHDPNKPKGRKSQNVSWVVFSLLSVTNETIVTARPANKTKPEEPSETRNLKAIEILALDCFYDPKLRYKLAAVVRQRRSLSSFARSHFSVISRSTFVGAWRGLQSFGF